MVNIGTLSAFTLVALGIPIMRRKRPDLPRAFRMPGNPWVPVLIALANFWLMLNLSVLTWLRFLVWLAIGFMIYFGYSYRHSRLGNGELVDHLPGGAGVRADTPTSSVSAASSPDSSVPASPAPTSPTVGSVDGE